MSIILILTFTLFESNLYVNIDQLWQYHERRATMSQPDTSKDATAEMTRCVIIEIHVPSVDAVRAKAALDKMFVEMPQYQEDLGYAIRGIGQDGLHIHIRVAVRQQCECITHIKKIFSLLGVGLLDHT
ncbi:MAG: hypothetical protein WCV69_00375 [Patescibacteria group bacterium]